ncbi:response regulator [Cohnella soli]|uniref:Response regulator n=1 Tax=Cohnella soli TaxID=425005 RepID=A0ABW0HMV2_9BACL
MKILIVEDERLTRESLVDSLRLRGYSDIETATDGNDALQTLDRFKPDLILSDIRMPGMDGLQLLGHIRDKGIHGVFIIISSYDSFEFAQKAVRLGAFSYMLKPIDDRELEDQLERAETSIRREQEQRNENADTGLLARKYRNLAQRQAIQKFVEEEHLNEEERWTALREADIRFEHPLYLVAKAKIDGYADPESHLSVVDQSLYAFGIANIASELMLHGGIDTYPFTQDDSIVFLLNVPVEYASSATERLETLWSHVAAQVRSHLKLTLTIGVGSLTDNIADVNDSYTQASKAAMSRIMGGGNRVYFAGSSEEKRIEATIAIDYLTEQKLLHGLEQGSKEAVRGLIRELYSPYFSRSNEFIGSLMKLNFSVAFTLFKLMHQLDTPPERFLGSELKVYRQMNQCADLSSLLSYCENMTDVCIDEIQAGRKLNPDTSMAKALAYIVEHYDQDIGLASVSEHVHMSPAYFSKQFKLKYNQNFIEFLIQFRINKAKELLKSGAYTAQEVSRMVGINDEKHFFRTFKKITGLTPGSYKKGN